MTRFVLAAIDIADTNITKTVLLKAQALADLEQYKLAVLTVVPDFGMSIVGAFFKEGAEAEAVKLTNQRLHEVVAQALGNQCEVKHIVRHGTVYKEILDTAEKINAGVIIMGSHRPMLQDYLLGPNAARVVRHSRISVYVLR